MTRCVIIGRDGQLARALARVLPAAGLDCAILARPEVDLARPAGLGAAIARLRPDVVVNAAAYTAVDRAEDEPELAFAVNATGAGALAAAADAAGAAIIHMSTDYVFDGTATRPYCETDATSPLGSYGSSKLAGEQLVATANPRHVILRTAWVASPDGSNFVRTMLRLAAERTELRVVDDQRGCPTFAADLAAAIAAVLPRLGAAAPASHYGVFHVVGRGETTWCGFARRIMQGSAQRGGRSVPVVAITTRDYPTRARRPAYSVLSTERIADVHGIVMPEWETSLDQCLDVLIGPASGSIAARPPATG